MLAGRSLEEIDLVFMKHDIAASHTPSWTEGQRESGSEEKVAIDGKKQEKM